jgi:hypothetical protein
MQVRVLSTRHKYNCNLIWKVQEFSVYYIMTKEQKREYERTWYKTIGKEKRDAANKKWELKKIAEFKEIKKNLKCNKCNEDDIACLDFHHLDPLEKDAAVGQIARKVSTKRLLEEIAKCEVLCSNCHRKLHYYAGVA